MIKTFATFSQWLVENNIPTASMKITISPQDTDAVQRFEAAWKQELSGRLPFDTSTSWSAPAAGLICGVPFEYNRP